MAAPGTPITRVLKQCRITPRSFAHWKNDPAFRAEYDAIVLERTRVDMAPFERFIGAIDRALIDKAIAGDVPAIRTVYERMGLLQRGGTTNVNVNATQQVGVTAQSVQQQAAAGDVGAIIERANNLQELIDRHGARLAAAEGRAELAGPEPVGGPAPE